MSDYQRSDGWEALRARLEAAERSGFRGGWVPRRRAATSIPGPGTAPAAGDVAPAEADVGAEAGEAPSGRPPLTRAHLSVVGLVTVGALVATLLVLWNAQPSNEAVPLAAAATADSAATASGMADATPTLPPSATLPPTAESGLATAEADEPVEVVVHVAGKVRRPGVVRLASGSRVIDAIDAAGGARKGADLSAVNLARELQDGEQVRVGLPPDPRVNAVAGGIGSTAGSGSASSASNGPLDLNAASATELESLPGVGPVLSERIVAYRDESGPFQTVDQLIEVPGIGPAVLASVKDLVHV